MRIMSETFEDGGEFPLLYTRDGDGMSPPLSWSGLPSGTRELALMFENITPGTQEPFVQWLLYKIPPEPERLPEGLRHKRDPEEPAAALHGLNDIGNVRYDGPLGTVGRTHRYRFRLFALDRPLDVQAGLDKGALEEAIARHTLDHADLVVSYERPR
jgi:Raf kinase inhibitor-like YbhB/YbcL family protein